MFDVEVCGHAQVEEVAEDASQHVHMLIYGAQYCCRSRSMVHGKPLTLGHRESPTWRYSERGGSGAVGRRVPQGPADRRGPVQDAAAGVLGAVVAQISFGQWRAVDSAEGPCCSKQSHQSTW